MPKKLKPREGRTEKRPAAVEFVEIEGGRANGSTLFVRVARGDDGVKLSLGASYSKLQLAITGAAAEELAQLAAPIVPARR